MSTATQDAAQPDTLTRGATAVVTHRVRPDHIDDYETWLTQISPVARRYPGFLDVNIVRPVLELTQTYVTVLRFRTRADLERWMDSDDRRTFMDRARPFLAEDDRFYLSTGLDFWFAPQGAKAQLPTRWKQALLTWSAIFPLVLFVPMLVLPPLHALGLPDSRPLDVLITTGIIVALMVYAIMPHFTRLVRRWLFA